MVIVGLGKAGCNIAKAFSKFPQYQTLGIDTAESADITIRQKSSHEEYDAEFPNLKRRLKFPRDDVLLILAGSGAISGGVLRLLEQIRPNPTTVLYIQPDLTLASERQRKQEKVVRNVLQEYARSGMIESIWLVDNQCIERGIGEVAIMGYHDILNQAVVNTVHMINIFNNSDPVIGSVIEPSLLSRIATVGIVDMDTEEEKWFYDLTHARDVVYYYGINEKQLTEDGTLFKKITNYVKSRVETGLNVSYGVFKTTYEQKYCYCIKYSSMVQSYGELLDDQDIG